MSLRAGRRSRLTRALACVALLSFSCSLGDDGGEADEGVLRMALVRPASLDPARAASVDEQVVADHLYDTLVSLDADTAEPRPGLAARWTISEDGLTWEFTLAGDAGVTAADVEATFDRAVRPATRSAVADLLEPVVGWREAVSGAASELAGVRAVSDDVVALTLSSPWSSLPVALAHPGLGIVRAGATDAVIAEGRNGTGPFATASRSADGLVLRPADGRRAKVDAVEVVFADDQAAAYEAFVGGDVDWAPVPIAKVEEAAARYGREHFRSYVAELFYAFNLRNEKWTDRRVREAVVRAVDRDAIVEEVYEGAVRPMRSLVPPGVPGAVGDACGDACAHDPERSKAIVAELAAEGYTVPEISIDFEGDDVQREVAERIEADLEAVGLAATLRPLPLDEYERFAASGEQDLFRLGWIGAYPTADAFVAPLFTTASGNNLPGFSVAAVDDLVARARAERDPAAATALYEQAERTILAELPIVPLGQFQQHWVASDRVRDLRLTVTGSFDISAVWLADD